MPAFHSKFNLDADNVDQKSPQSLVGNMAILPLRTSFRGPATRIDDSTYEDVIDEALLYFRPNVFFRNFEIKGPADRTLIYLFLYITECLKRILHQKIVQKLQASKELTTLAIDSRRGFPIPGEQAFPFPSLFKPPANSQDEEIMRNYLQQLRQEMGVRLLERIFPNPDGMPSKWWLCFAKRRFMDKQLTHTL
uniref:Actin-related protein 2/3 complex subunit 3 n=1 Tax=Meloidogyne incognita TaxID=6306 RepID=A0A914MJR4_MELIC